MRTLPLLILAALTAGCGGRPTTIPVWQRFDMLQPVLAGVTADSYRVASDLAAVQHAMARESSSRVRSGAISAKLDALRLSGQAGAAAYGIRPLLLEARAATAQRLYLSALLGALREQWEEGRSVARVADVVWSDPLLLSPRNVSRILTIQRQADRSSEAAAAYCRRASVIRSEAPAGFWYVPVKPAGPDTRARA